MRCRENKAQNRIFTLINSFFPLVELFLFLIFFQSLIIFPFAVCYKIVPPTIVVIFFVY